MTPEQAYELSLLALLVWREARNQPWAGKLAVAWSVRNRVFKAGTTWWGDDWEEVILHPWQYSSFNKNDPNAVLLPGDPKRDVNWGDCLRAAQLAYDGVGPDPSLGATHYYNPHAGSPNWIHAAGSVRTVRIADHDFWKVS